MYSKYTHFLSPCPGIDVIPKGQCIYLRKVTLKLKKVMFITYTQDVKDLNTNKKYHFIDEKYRGKVKKPIKVVKSSFTAVTSQSIPVSIPLRNI